MNAVVVVVRLYVGAWMLFNGLNYFLHFVPQPMGLKSHYLHVAFMQSGLFAIAKLSEIFLGVSLLSNRLVPVSLVMVFPVTVIVAWLAIVIEDPRPAGTILFIGHVFLLYAYLPHFISMLTWRARPLKSVREIAAGAQLLCRHAASEEPLIDTEPQPLAMNKR